MPTAHKNSNRINSTPGYPWPARSASSGTLSVTAPTSSAERRSAPPSQAQPVSWWVILPSVLSIACLIMVLLGQKAQLASSQYTLVRLKGQLTKLNKQQDELKIRLQRLSALERVDALARTKLHMAAPSGRMVLDLRLPRVAASTERAVGYASHTGFSEGSF